MSRADTASRNRPSHIDLQLPDGKTPCRRILPRSDGAQGLIAVYRCAAPL